MLGKTISGKGGAIDGENAKAGVVTDDGIRESQERLIKRWSKTLSSQESWVDKSNIMPGCRLVDWVEKQTIKLGRRERTHGDGQNETRKLGAHHLRAEGGGKGDQDLKKKMKALSRFLDGKPKRGAGTPKRGKKKEGSCRRNS